MIDTQTPLLQPACISRSVFITPQGDRVLHIITLQDYQLLDKVRDVRSCFLSAQGGAVKDKEGASGSTHGQTQHGAEVSVCSLQSRYLGGFRG